MHAPERLEGMRIVALPRALDAARYTGAGTRGVTVLRIAVDEVLALGAITATVDDPHAIIERETAFVGWDLSHDEFTRLIARHIEWSVPTTRPALAQGLIAALPLKLYFDGDRVLMIASSGLVHEVVARLGVTA